MEKNIFDLHQFREERLHLSQKELANLLGLRQDNISRMEQNPDQLSIAMLVKLAGLAGQSPNEILNYHPVRPSGLNVKDTWTEAESRLAPVSRRLETFDRPYNSFYRSLDSLKNLFHTPVLTVAGESFSGKSTFINSLLGRNLLSTGPRSCISHPVRIRHIYNRPWELKKEVYLIQGTPDAPARTFEKAFKKYSELNPETDHFPSDPDEMILAAGGPELLSSEADFPETDEILVYTDSSILRNCDILRLPYPDFSGKPYDNAEFDYYLSSDMLVYLIRGTTAAASVPVEVSSYFRLLLQRMRILKQADDPGVLGNLFVVCSKAHLLGNTKAALEMAKVLGSSLYSTLPPSLWEKRQKTSGIPCTETDFLSRCFFYAVHDNLKWRESLENALCAAAERMPDVICRDILQSGKEYRDNMVRLLSIYLKPQEIVPFEAPLPPSSMSGPERQEAAYRQFRHVLDAIARCRSNSVDAFELDCDEMIPGNAEFYNDKDQLQLKIADLLTRMEQKLEEILGREYQIFLEEAEKYRSYFSHLPANIQKDFQDKLLKQVPPITYIQWRFGQKDLAGADGRPEQTGSPESTTTASEVSSMLIGPVPSSLEIFGGAGISVVSSVVEMMDAARATTSAKKIAKIVQNVFRDETIPFYEDGIRRFWNNTQDAFEKAAKNLQDIAPETPEDLYWESFSSTNQRAEDAQALTDFLVSLPL